MFNNLNKLINRIVKEKETILDLSNRNLSEIPESVFSLTWIKKLNLSNNRIEKISDNLSNLKHLSELNLSNNKLSEFPTSLFGLSSLSKLNISKNNIRIVPKEIYKIQNINFSHLNLSHNQISEIPNELSSLTLLSHLDLSHNNLNKLPESLKHIGNLIRFDLSNNQFTDIPEFLFYYKNLEIRQSSSHSHKSNLSLVLDNNPIESPPVEILKQGVIAVRNYFKELGWGEEYLFEAKLLIVGEPGAGKTTLAKCLINPDYTVDEKEKSTEGIEVSNYIFPSRDGKNFHLNIWDFGGQEIYHATHQFFLTKRSLYVLLSDTRAEDSNFQYWLNIIELLTKNSPLLIVQNEKQERKRELNELGIRGRFSNLVKVIQTNLKTKRNLETLTEHIKENVQSLPHIGSKLPKSWLSIRKVLEQRAKRENYIHLSEYFNICESNGINDEDRALHLSDYLHDLGVFLHFQDNLILRKIIILNPTWGTDAVYKVLDNSFVISQNGNFSYSTLNKIWKTNEYKNVREELLALMMKFELCYQIDDFNNYIAPQLLPVEQPIYPWIDTPNITVKYKYEFMPKGIMTRFTVRMHSYIENQEWVWKEGVILTKDTARAEIIEIYGKKEIQIRIGGEGVDNRRKFLTIILEEFDKIHSTYANIRVDKYIPCICDDCKLNKHAYYYKFEVLEKYKSNGLSKIRCQESLVEIYVSHLLEGTFGKKNKVKIKKNIYISYSDKDLEYVNNLIKHLSILKNVIIWEKSMILPGQNIEEETNRRIQSTALALLIISPDSCIKNEKEIYSLLSLRNENKLDVIPIIVRDGHYHDQPFSILQSLPKEDDFDNSDKVWKKIIDNISKII